MLIVCISQMRLVIIYQNNGQTAYYQAPAQSGYFEGNGKRPTDAKVGGLRQFFKIGIKYW